MTLLENLLNWDSIEKALVKAIEDHPLKENLRLLIAQDAVILVRSWYGQLMLLLPCSPEALERSGCLVLLEALKGIAGGLALPTWYVCRDELFDAESYWDDPALLSLGGLGPSGIDLRILDRQDKEGDWLKRVDQPDTFDAQPAKPRAVFFGVKGGVGRSSALTALALALAQKGRKVLVLDFDFESPGLSSTLLGDVQPAFGLVDWLTAQALGTAPQSLRNMAATQLVETSPLSQLTTGRIVVAPAYAAGTQSYVAKLGRIYRNAPNGQTFAQRLSALVSLLEQTHRADITLIDSRAGIDDMAAVAITQLEAKVSLLFALNSPQTWKAYQLLFEHLQRHPTLHTDKDFRGGLKLVSALTPEEVGAYKGYWSDWLQNAYQTCQTIYDEDDGSGDQEVFSPAPDDQDGPHFGLKIRWHEVLRSFNPLEEPGQLAPALMAAVFGDFIEKTCALLEEPP